MESGNDSLFGDTWVPGYPGTRVPGYPGTRVPGYPDTRIQLYLKASWEKCLMPLASSRLKLDVTGI